MATIEVDIIYDQIMKGTSDYLNNKLIRGYIPGVWQFFGIQSINI